MMKTENIQVQAKQYVEGFQMMLRGMSMMFGTMAEAMAAGLSQTHEAEQSLVPEESAKNQGPTTVTAPAVEAPGARKITRSDLERAMAAKIKELSSKGEGPDAIGALFPKFHNAQCITDLETTDYPAFLEELAKI